MGVHALLASSILKIFQEVMEFRGWKGLVFFSDFQDISLNIFLVLSRCNGSRFVTKCFRDTPLTPRFTVLVTHCCGVQRAEISFVESFWDLFRPTCK